MPQDKYELTKVICDVVGCAARIGVLDKHVRLPLYTMAGGEIGRLYICRDCVAAGKIAVDRGLFDG